MPHRAAPFPAVGTALLLTAAAAGWRAQRSVATDGRGSDAEDHGAHANKGSATGRGREADAPWRIPAVGWKDILWRTYAQVGEDRLLAVAAGVVFYGLLAVFPTITSFVSLYGLFADVSTVTAHVSLVESVAPAEVTSFMREQTERIAATTPRTLGLASAGSLAFALWSANAGMKALFDALNVAYGERETRGFFRLNLVALTFTLASIVFLLAAIGAVVVMPVVFSALGLQSVVSTVIAWLRWPMLLFLVALGLSLLYRFGPSRENPRWQWVSAGSVTAAFLWLAGSGLLSWYLSNFANYNATYGSLGAVIGLMMWVWLTAIIVLLGAELNAEVEHQTARDTTTGEDKPQGARGAQMADTVGEERAA